MLTSGGGGGSVGEGVCCGGGVDHEGFTGGAIPYHVSSYWGIFIEEKMTEYIGGYIGGRGFLYWHV